MNEEPTKEEVDRQARELARRVMSKPHQKQEWPGKPKAAPKTEPKKKRTPAKRVS